jgi:hypothetical protein
MNADIDKWYQSKWTWLAFSVSFIMIFSAIWWSTITMPAPKKIDTTMDEPLPIDSQNNTGAGSRYSVPPPPGIPGAEPRPTVDITPQMPASAGSSVPDETPVSEQKVAKPRAQVPDPTHEQNEKQTETSVRGMFPVGKVVKKEAAPPASSEQAPAQDRQLPSVSCNGRNWEATGKYADSGQLNLAPTSCQLDGRSLYALADAGDVKVLFLPSKDNPDRLAIYR